MKIRVAVLCGGRSGEHEISLRSAESIVGALDPERYQVTRIFIDKEGKWNPGPILPEPGAHPEIDVVFPALHGTFGEDGTVQGLLELADLAYVGAGVFASAASMDKAMMKRIFRECGIAVVDYAVLYRENSDPERVEAEFAYPVFVKPANLGSSVGISKAKDRSQLEAALKLAGEFDRKIVVERAIAGREFECSVLGNEDPQASIPCEILPSREFYDYEDKYLLNQARFELPAKLEHRDTAAIQHMAVAAFEAVECSGLARVDFLREEATGNLFVNEINTMPGFTSISMYPKMWEYSGVSYPELLDRLISLALEKHAVKKATRFTR